MPTRTQPTVRPVAPQPPPSTSGPTAGLIAGVVEDTNDPESRGRVLVRFDLPGEDGADRAWARIAGSWARENFGVPLPPRVGDEVLIGFLNADRAQPVILGGLWNGDPGGVLRADHPSRQQIDRVIDHAVDLFGSRERALGWLDSPIVALGGVTPGSLFDTEEGIRRVDDILGRIEYGVYS